MAWQMSTNLFRNLRQLYGERTSIICKTFIRRDFSTVKTSFAPTIFTKKINVHCNIGKFEARAMSHHHSYTCNRKVTVKNLSNTIPKRFYITSTSSGAASKTKSASMVSKPPRPRTKNPTALRPKDKSQWLSTAYSTSEEFQLEHLSLDLQTHEEFKIASMPTDAHDVLHMNVALFEEQEEVSEMFVFRNGCLIFWNVPGPMINKVLKIAAKHQSEPYEVALVNWENEQMNYSYDEGATRLRKDSFIFSSSTDPYMRTLEKFAFSNAMMLSVKLAMWEYILDKFVSSIEHIPETLKNSGKLKMSHKTTIKHIGELYLLRHRINLSSDLLNTPDFYWDREDLETLFTKTCQFFSVDRRTRVINDKLNHCHDLMHLMRNDVADQHSLRLEVMITLLIAVEIVIEISHYTV